MRFWARGTSSRISEEDLRALGIDPESYEPPEPERFKVMPENIATLDLFFFLAKGGQQGDCWRVVGMGTITGFDWVQAKALLELAGKTPTPEQIDELREMGRETAAIWK